VSNTTGVLDMSRLEDSYRRFEIAGTTVSFDSHPDGPWTEIPVLTTSFEISAEKSREVVEAIRSFGRVDFPMTVCWGAIRSPAARGRRSASKRARFYARRRVLRGMPRTAPYRCPWCGAPSWREDVPRPVDYCHDDDHGAIE
jgi:hypothetical protein